MIKRWRGYFILFALVATGLFVFLPRPVIDPLPADDDVVDVVARGFFLGCGSDQVEFQLPLSHWPRGRAALEPATRDDHPAGWVHLGGLSITTRSQRKMVVLLFDTSTTPPGAFAAGPSVDRRIYYRGGDSTKLVRELAVAYATSQRKNSSK